MTDPQERKKGVIKVKLLRANKVVRSYKVRADTFTIGSAKGCTIRAAGDPAVSPKHATIYIEENELMLVPEQGALVYLNGEEVDFAVPASDDIIKIGRLTLQVELVASLDSIPPGRASKAPATASPRAQQTAPASAATAAKPVATGAEDRVSAPPPSRRTSVAPPSRVSAPPPSRSAPSPLSGLNDNKTPVVPIEAMSMDDDDTQTVSASREPAVSPGPATTGELGGFDDFESEYYLSTDEEDEESFEESFDLASMLLEGAAPAKKTDDGPKEDYCAAHVIRVVNGSVVDTFGVSPKTPYSSGYGEVHCRIERDKARTKGALDETVFLETAGHVSGTVTMKGELRSLQPSESSGMVTMILHDGDSASLSGRGGNYKIEVYRPPLAPKKVPFLTISPRMLALVIVIAAALHGAAAYGLRFLEFATLDDYLEEEAEESFAEVKLDEPEKKIEEVVPEEAPEEDAKSIAERAPKVSKRQVRKVKEQPKTAVNNLLNILSKGSGKEGKTNKLKDLISNIDAVAGPGASSFSIAGAIASLPGDGVNIAKSGGGGIISTLSGDQVAGAGSGIASVGKVKKKGKVRGKVTKMSSGAKVGGSLSRADVLKVINSHFHQVQACYERALMQNPTLSGRIAFDWTVSTTGSVKGVRVRSSTLGSPQVATCISKLIKRWKFPRPKGGDATITFPFLFRVGS